MILHAQQHGSYKTGVADLPYASGSIPRAIQPQVARWMTSRFDFLIDGTLNFAPYLNGISWSKYTESAYLYAPQVYPFIHEMAATNGFSNPENILLHINQDYTVSAGLAWKNLDQFDFFEQPGFLTNGSGTPAQAVNGAFTLVGGTYTDVTASLYDGAHQTTMAGDLLLGYAEPFDLVNVSVLTGRAGGAVSWQYWNGNWSALTPASDTTNAFASSGVMQFKPPPDWVPSVVNGSRSKYWIRAMVSQATVNPVLSRVYGDDWASHSGTNNIRGWSASDPNRVNVGLGNLEYNPNPPANATARFRYQARATGFWAPNVAFGNPADVQNGQSTWAMSRITNWQTEYAAVGLSYNSAFLDDGGAQPAVTSPAMPIESLSDLGSGNTWEGSVSAMLTAFRNQMRATRGNNFKVGINTPDQTLARLGDFSLDELVWGAPLTGNIPYTMFDGYLPAANPLNTNGIFAAWDNMHFGGSLSGYPFRWDRANRSPIAMLASQAIAGNPNVSMFYNTLGWSYPNSDEYYYWSPGNITLAAPVSADASNASKALVLSDDSAIALPGGPIWSNPAVASSAAQAGNIYGYAFLIGSDIIQPFKDSAGHWHTYSAILSGYPAGTPVKFAMMGHQAVDPVPSAANVWYWAAHFPAMDVDLGQPDPNGWNHGARDTKYIVAPASSGNPSGCKGQYSCPEFWRRDFINAIVIAHVFHDGNMPSELDTYGPATPIQLGGSFYPLSADGTTGAAITTLQLRAGEAAILLKSPAAPPEPAGPPERGNGGTVGAKDIPSGDARPNLPPLE